MPALVVHVQQVLKSVHACLCVLVCCSLVFYKIVKLRRQAVLGGISMKDVLAGEDGAPV